MITLKNQQTVPVDLATIKKDAKKILKALDYGDFDLGILLTDSQHMHELNKQYRHQDKPTDVLSFAYYPALKAGQKIEAQNTEEKNLGDIVICPQYVQEDLDRWGQSFKERMRILLVHGICHLLGYDHIKDEDYVIMHQKEAELLATLMPNKNK